MKSWMPLILGKQAPLWEALELGTKSTARTLRFLPGDAVLPFPHLFRHHQSDQSFHLFSFAPPPREAGQEAGGRVYSTTHQKMMWINLFVTI